MKVFLKNNSGQILRNSSGNYLFTWKLPSEYQKVEYIQATGTQRIKLDIQPTSKYKIEEIFAITDKTVTSCLWCARGTTTGNLSTTAFNLANSQLRCDYGSSAAMTSIGAINANQIYTLTMDSEKWYLDGVLKTSMSAATFTSGSKLQLLASHYNGIDSNLGNYAKLKLYKFRVWDTNREIVCNLIPCYRKSDNVIGMYDVINDVFYINNGTGAFLKGPDVKRLPSNYLEVEYLQNTGTGYINTEISALNKLFKIDLQFTSNDTRQLMGISGSSSAYWGNNKGTWEKVGTTGTGKTTLDRVVICYDVGNITAEKTNTWIEGAINKYAGSDTNWATASANPLRIFNLAGGSYNCKMKLYEVKVYDNQGHLLNHLIPCIAGGGSDTRGVYDLVLNKFTAATGSLTVGPYV